MNRFKAAIVALSALSGVAIGAAAQSPTALAPAPAATPTTVATAPLPKTGDDSPAQLTKTDVDAWLDGYMPYALKAGGIPGAVVVVVKDGQVLTQRGFGYSDVAKQTPVDPERTLFRPGSVSKLLTWTALMQLVEQGKVDLDADVNKYIDFNIPPYKGKPVTVRNLMTHTTGFSETAKYLIDFGEIHPDRLGPILSRWIPDRLYEPGTMPAYSNYGASLAGYIVERVSGQRFEDYIDQHVTGPIGMAHSTFKQPLPANLKPMISKGYKYGSNDPQPFEVIGMSPAGSLTASGADMGKFMIAHLDNGGKLLKPETRNLMYQAQATNPFKHLPGMALGFYHEDRNGLDIVGHGGDTVFFHSDLHLIPEKNVGFFVSMNSGGKNTAVHPLRAQLFDQFVDRYFPVDKAKLPTASTAKEHGQALAGNYVSSRAGGWNFLRLAALLGQAKVTVDQDGILSVSSITDPSGQPRRWREVGPWLWQQIGGDDQLEAVVDNNGKVQMFSITPFGAIIEFLPAPASLNASWILPLAGIAFLIVLIAAIGWPVNALVRRRYKQKALRDGRDLQLHRATRITAWLFVVLAVGWFAILSVIDKDLSALNGGIDPWMRLLQLVLLVAIVGTALALWNAYRVASSKGTRWWTKAWAILVALSLVFLAWLCLDTGLLTASLDF